MRNKRIYVVLLFFVCFLIGGCGHEKANRQISEKNFQVVSKQSVEPNSGAERFIEAFDTEISDEINGNSQKYGYDIVVDFAGDINFADDWSTMQFYRQQEHGISDCISQDLIDEMNAADIMWINNEFTYSTRGNPMEGKLYTFRAEPEHVNILKQLGVDVAGLANNHIFDYGKEAFLDTLDTLSNAGIAYGGAGKHLEEAMQPVYVEAEGKRIAFVAASRAEKNRMTPQATSNSPGILRCYDTALFKQAIEQARQNADYVIACVHWGTEYSTKLESVQKSTAREYLDAGADAIIGAHTHCLQGFEFYNGKPIVYSLGNFWFNEKTLDTMLLKLHITENGIRVQVLPAVQSGFRTRMCQDTLEKERIYRYLESISEQVGIDKEGMVSDAS